MSFISYKVPDGKLIKVKLVDKGDRIESITLTGDFFLHPESCIFSIEEAILGARLEVAELEKLISTVLQDESAQVIGATAKDFAKAIILASEKGT